MKTAKKEETFEQAAKKYADCAIENIREMIEAMDHAGECNGEMECETCNGTGVVGPVDDGQGQADANTEGECSICKGTGTVPCTEGKDSDDPESWHNEERARQRIHDDALSVEVRSNWYTPGDTDTAEAAEYCILITTGGPAARIIGDLDRGQPTSAYFEYQDWGKPWTEVNRNSADESVLLQYAQSFYFGD